MHHTPGRHEEETMRSVYLTAVPPRHFLTTQAHHVRSVFLPESSLFAILDRDSCLMPLHSWLRCRISALPVLLCSYQRSRWCVRIYSSTLLLTPYVNKYLSSRDRHSLPGDSLYTLYFSWAGATPSNTSVLHQNCVNSFNTIQQPLAVFALTSCTFRNSMNFVGDQPRPFAR